MNTPNEDEEVNKVKDLLSQLSLVVKKRQHDPNNDMMEDDTKPIIHDCGNDDDNNNNDAHKNHPQTSSSSSSSNTELREFHEIIQAFVETNHHPDKKDDDINFISMVFEFMVPNFFFQTTTTTTTAMDVDSQVQNSRRLQSSVRMSQSEALQTMIGVVSTNPEKYTLPAMKSIYKYIQNELPSHWKASASESECTCSSSSSTHEFNVTNEFLETIVQQVQHPSTELSQCASTILSLLMTTIPSSSHQRHLLSMTIVLLYTHLEKNVHDLPKGKRNATMTMTRMMMVDPSIALIRNASLLMDILLPTSNTSMFLLVSNLQSTLSENDDHHRTSPLLSSILNFQESVSTTSTATVLDPIAAILMNQTNNSPGSGGGGGGGNDPLLIMNIFEILEKITISTNFVLQSWIDDHMIPILLSQVGYPLVDNTEDGLSSTVQSLVSSGGGGGDIDVFNYISALTILSKCCSSAAGAVALATAYPSTQESDHQEQRHPQQQQQQQQQILSPDKMIVIFQYILNNCIVESRDNSEKIRYIGALTNFLTDERHCDINERLKLLMQEGSILKWWFHLKKQGNSDFKAAVLHSIAQVLHCKNEGDGDSPAGSGSGSRTTSLVNDMCTTMHNAIGYVNNSTAMDIYMELMKSSIDEIRLATYEVIKATIVNRKRSIGISQIVAHDGFLRLLLTRNVELTKEGQELKYDITRGVLESDMKRLLSPGIIKSLEKYVEQGPFYVDAVSGDMLIE